MTKEVKSYVRFNSLVNVDVLKVDSNITDDFTTAKTKKNTMYSTTVLLNTYDNTIDADYFSPEDELCGAVISVYKKTPSQNYYRFVCTLEDGRYSFHDYNIVSNQYYHYQASIEVQTSSGIPKYTVYENKFYYTDDNGDTITEPEYFKTSWDDFTICNIYQTTEDNVYTKDGDIWTFKYNMEGEDITQNTSVTTWDTLSQYSRTSKGTKNYDTSTITAMLGDIKEYNEYSAFEESEKVYGYTEKYTDTSKNEYYYYENEKLQRWKDFCNDGELKLLKDRKGNAWIVQIAESPTYSINLTSNLNQTVVSFTWVEVSSLDNVIIVKYD
jgi:L-rhamnose mutarotase